MKRVKCYLARDVWKLKLVDKYIALKYSLRSFNSLPWISSFGAPLISPSLVKFLERFSGFALSPRYHYLVRNRYIVDDRSVSSVRSCLSACAWQLFSPLRILVAHQNLIDSFEVVVSPQIQWESPDIFLGVQCL